MRRAVARGRMLPQSLSTDPRYGRLSLKAVALFPLMWANCDDQGRISGDPDEIKYAACPNIDHITKGDIPALLKELETEGMLKVYTTSKTRAIQMLDWWEEQKLQWAYPSRYSPHEGWADHLRYHSTPKEIITENWPPPGRLPSALPNAPTNSLPNAPANSLPNAPANSLPSTKVLSPLTTLLENKKEKEENKEGRGNLPSVLGSRSPPSLTTDLQIIYSFLIKSFRHEWGRVPAGALDTVIEREPSARELAQLRDLGKELSTRGGVPLDYIKEAFGEAAGVKKFHISYVRAILLDWLGIERGRGPP